MKKKNLTTITTQSNPARAWLAFTFAPNLDAPEEAVRYWTVMASTMEEAMAEGLAVDKDCCGYEPGQPCNLRSLIAFDVNDLQELRDQLISWHCPPPEPPEPKGDGEEKPAPPDDPPDRPSPLPPDESSLFGWN